LSVEQNVTFINVNTIYLLIFTFSPVHSRQYLCTKTYRRWKKNYLRSI